MSDQSNSSLNFNDRSIRVFISSTFKDMKEERDILAKQIFPQIRKICEDRAVTFTDIDLRWGINDEQKAEGEVLPICLETIEQCRPYFIGILGERYGWIQKTISDELAEKESWLKEQTERSITELEIMHGVLNNPSMEKNALFYFRELSYVDSISSEEKENLIESPIPEEIEQFGLKKANELAEKRKQKLQSLKQDIRNSPFPVTEYMSPKELGEAILKDLTALVNKKYPEDTKPDPHEQETSVHEAFARERTRVYIENADLIESLDKHAQSADQPLVILGESGSGKSALLANWISQYREKHPDEIVFTHFIGATSSSTDWEAMLRRIMVKLKHCFDIQQDIPEDKNELKLAFANWLHMASVQDRFVLVIDALNQLEDMDGALDLVWLPSMIPENVRVIVSTLPGRSQNNLNERGWNTLEVPLQDIDRRKKLIWEYLAHYGKNPTPAQVDMIASYPQTNNPLYLCSLLEELRLHGDHFTVDRQFAWYLEARTVEELFDKILMRWERDYESDRPGLVRDAMSYIWASRKGLSESELAGILGNEDDDPLPKAYWIPLYLAAEKLLVNRSGLIDYSHEHLRNAVQKRYISNIENEMHAHIQLAKYFASKDADNPRLVYEFPWQLSMSKQWDSLYTLLSDPVWLQLMWLFDEYDVKTYWKNVESYSNYRMVGTYDISSTNWQADYDYWFIVTKLFHDTAHFDEAMKLYMEQERICSEMSKTGGLSESFGNQGLIHFIRGELERAMELHKKAEKICRELDNLDGLQRSLGNQANILQIWGQLDEAMKLYKEQEQICHELGKLDGLQASLGNQGAIHWTRGQVDEAMKFYKEQERICRNLGDLDSLQAVLGNQANILQIWGQLDEAMKLHKEGERICRELDNLDGLQRSLCNQAVIHQTRGKVDVAVKLLKEQERICHELGNLNDLQVSLGNQAVIHRTMGQVDEAMKLLKEQERICHELGNLNSLQICLVNQGIIHRTRGQLDEALKLFKEQERICRKLSNLDGLQKSFDNQIQALIEKLPQIQDKEEALEIHKQLENIFREVGDEDYLQRSLKAQAQILIEKLPEMQDKEEALEIHKQLEIIFREVGDEDYLQISLKAQAQILIEKLSQIQDKEEMLEIHKQLENIFREVGDEDYLQRSLNAQAQILIEKLPQTQDKEEVLEICKQLENIYREIDDEEHLKISLNAQKQILIEKLPQTQDKEEELKIHKQLESIFLDLGDKNNLHKALENQTDILEETNQFCKALDIYEKWEKLCRNNVEDEDNLHKVLESQAAIYITTNQSDKVIDICKKWEKLCRETTNHKKLVDCLLGQMFVQFKTIKNLQKALELAEEAYSISQEQGYTEDIEIISAYLDEIRGSL